MSSCLQSYRICCRCATVELPDFIISNVLPHADCHSVLETFLLHFNINLSPSDLAVVVLIFSGRRLNTKDSVGAVFGSVPVTIPILPLQVALAHSLPSGPVRSCYHPTCLDTSAQVAPSCFFVCCTCPSTRSPAQIHCAIALIRPHRFIS
jgi:hypothetical protein